MTMTRPPEKRRLGVVRQTPGKPLRLLVVSADPATTGLLRGAFYSVSSALLDITPSAKTATLIATHNQEPEPYLDPREWEALCRQP